MLNQDIAKILPGTKRQLKSATTVVYQGEVPRSCFFVIAGLIKSYTLSDNGEEQIANFHQPGDFLPLPWLFDLTTSSFYYYETLEPTKLISITKADFKSLLQTNSQVKDHTYQQLIKNHTGSQLRITALEQSRAVDKILFTLYYLLYQFGEKTTDGDYLIKINLTHAMIASLIGLTRETTATELSKLKRKQIVSYNRKTYRVNKKRLESLIGDDSFSELITG